jgi:Leucine-rich repeat (LRR) protein
LNDLEYLALGGNAYNSSIPSTIARLPSLSHLYMENSYIDGTLDFAPTMLSIEELWIEDNIGLSGTLPSEMYNLQSLSSLSLSRCSLSGSIPSEFGMFNPDAFKEMWLYGNQLTGAIPSELGNLSLLTKLELVANNLTGDVPIEMCGNVIPLGFLSILEVDCDGEVDCSCCTCCGEGCVHP